MVIQYVLKKRHRYCKNFDKLIKCKNYNKITKFNNKIRKVFALLVIYIDEDVYHMYMKN